MRDLSDHGGGSGRLVPPGGGEDTLRLVVTAQPVDPGLDENETELGILVLSALLQVLADADGLLDQEVDVLWEVRSKSFPLQDPQDLVTGDETDLGDTVAVPEDDTDLGWGQAFLGQLVDLVLDIGRAQLEPGRNGATVWEGTLGDTLAWSVHATHGDLLVA